MKFGHLILRRIVKIVATKCQILRLKCTKIDFGRVWGEFTALPQTPWLDLRGPTSKGEDRKSVV